MGKGIIVNDLFGGNSLRMVINFALLLASLFFAGYYGKRDAKKERGEQQKTIDKNKK
jgi:hypothetical protein